MSLPLKQVITHLQSLRSKMESLESEGDWQAAIEKRRSIAEQYVDVDASVTVMPESIIRQPTAVFEAIKGDWFFHPDVPELRNRLLYIHGCGGANGRLSPRLSFAAKIAEATSTAVLAVDYRLLPHYPHSASLADCLAAYAWILIHGPDDNRTALNTYVLGEAEGGTLALSMLQAIKQRDLKFPTAAAALSPFTDWSGTSDSWTTLESVDPYLSRQFLYDYQTRFLGGFEDFKDPTLSPLYGQLEGLPPLLLQVGGREILLDDAKRYAEKVTAANGLVSLDIFPGMPHAFQLFSPFLEEARNALKQIADFFHCSTQPLKTGEVVYMRAKAIKS